VSPRDERLEWLASHASGASLELGPWPDPADGLDLADDCRDRVLVDSALERSRDPEKALGEIVRVAKPGATIAIVADFGHSSDPAQRSAFYPASLLDVLADRLEIERIEVVGGHFRVAGRPGSTGTQRRLEILAELQPKLEIRFVHAQVEAQRQARRAARRKERLAQVRRRYQHQARRAQRLGQELRTVRRSRRSQPLRRAARALRRRGRNTSPPRVGDRPGVTIPDVPLAAGPIARPELKVAVILDTFSAMSFRYEWSQIEFGPGDWVETFERERPQLLFVESAWQGNDGRWSGAMKEEGPSASLRAVVAWCRRQTIPTVFWAKEDPPNFDRFLQTAGLFDHVFTVDGDCVPRYREALGHDRVGLMQFAAQPRVHNPIAVDGGREYEVAFAGSYVAHRHPARRSQMEAVLEPALSEGLHVYSRLPGVRNRDFPGQYDAHVVGSLSYDRMLAAYKRYKLFLNVNSVSASPTMCARRLFELSGCATPVLSGPSRAIQQTFGDAIPVAESPAETRRQLRRLLDDSDLRGRLAHRALREVLSHHTYGQRVDQVLRAVGLPVVESTPTVSVLMSTKRPERVDDAIDQVASQTLRPLQFVLVLHGIDREPEAVAQRVRRAGIDDAVVLGADASLSLGACMNVALDAADGDLVAKMDDDDLYGAHYLADLASAFQYAEAPIVGKAAHYLHLPESGATVLRFPGREHTYVDHVKGATIMAQADVLRRLRWDDVPVGVDSALFDRVRLEGIKVYSADRFSFAAVRRRGQHAHTWSISDGRLMEDAGEISTAPVESYVRV
jgi:spore maturation protein CgeB